MTQKRNFRSSSIADWFSPTVKNLSAIVAIILVSLGLLGYVYSFGQVSNSVEQDLDRNCRFLAIIEANTRFIIIAQTTSKVEAEAFREIFRNATRDTCG